MPLVFRLLFTICLTVSLLLPAAAYERKEPQIQVSVMEPDRKSASAAIGEEHNWYIQCSFPERPKGKRYTIVQTLSPGLTYEQGSLEVFLLSGKSLECRLDMEEHFLLTAGSVFVEEGTADRICIALTEEGSGLLFPNAQLQITYRAELNITAPMGTQIPASAQLTCLDEEGGRTVYLSDKATVSTGGFSIRLTDPSGDPIAGGKFMVAREAGEEEKESVVETLDTGDGIFPVVYVPFCSVSGEKGYTAETDLEGNARCIGLRYGEYYLVHTELPEGNGLLSPPVNVTVNEVSHLTYADGWRQSDGTVADHTVRIVTGSLLMPETGGPGTLGYTVSGILVIVSACLLLWFNRKKGIPI